MRSDLFNAFMYALVVGAVMAGAGCVFLVAIEVGRAVGIIGFLGSLLLFPITWLLGPLAIGLGTGEWTITMWLGVSLLFAALPFMFTLRARRTPPPAPRRPMAPPGTLRGRP